MASIDVNGTLFWETGLPAAQSGRVEGAVVKYRNGSTSGSIGTNDGGDFQITQVDDSKDLILVLLHEGGRSSTVALPAGTFADQLEIRLVPNEGPAAPVIGGLTLGLFVVALAVLTTAYLNTHAASVDDANKKYADLIEVLKTVPTTLAAAEGGALATRQEAVREAKQSVDELYSPATGELNELVENVVTYRIAVGATNVDDLAQTIQSAVDELRDPVGRFFWSAWPWVLVELWSWGLFGVLVTKIVRIGWYLRISSYHANGTWMHLAHAVATPILATVAVLLLSFLKIEGESQTIVDFSNPLFMVVTAFLLSTNPWGLWDFVLGQGDALRAKAESATTK